MTRREEKRMEELEKVSRRRRRWTGERRRGWSIKHLLDNLWGPGFK